MTLKTRPVRLSLLSLLSAPLAGAKINAQLSQSTPDGVVLPSHEIDGTDVVPLVVPLTEDPAKPGDYLGNFWPNTRGSKGTRWLINVAAGELLMKSLNLTVIDGSSAVEVLLKVMVDAPPYAQVFPSSQVVSVAQGYANAAGNFASLAAASAQRAIELGLDLGDVAAAAGHGQAAATSADAAAVSAGLANVAKVLAEAALDSINTSGKVFTAAEGVAAGIAATTNQQQFAVLDADLLSYGIWRNNSGTAFFLSSSYTAAYLDSLVKRTIRRGWVHVLRSAGGKLGLGINRAGRVIFGVGGDIDGRITEAESGVLTNTEDIADHKELFRSDARGNAVFRLLDSARTKVALEVNRAGRLVSMGRDVLAEIDLSALLRSFFKVKVGGRGMLFSLRDAAGKAPLMVTRSGRTKLLGRDVLAEVDVVAAQMTALLTNPALISKYVSTSNDLTLLGDSQISGAGPTPWRTLIVPSISARNYRNLAIGGQTSTHIAARFGAIAPLVTVAGNTIPASGPVSITFCRVLKIDGTLDDVFTPITSQGSNTLYGSLAGVLGTWTRAVGDGAYTFTRASSGAAVNCPENTPFKPVWADYDINTLVIGLGRNNITDPSTIKRDIEACSTAQGTVEKRQIILTVTNGGSIAPGVATNEGIGTTVGNNIAALELWAESRFTGPGFVVVNVRKLLMPYHDGNADDLSDVAAGTVPRSLRIDTVHYSAAAHQIISDHIASIINSKGW